MVHKSALLHSPNNYTELSAVSQISSHFATPVPFTCAISVVYLPSLSGPHHYFSSSFVKSLLIIKDDCSFFSFQSF